MILLFLHSLLVLLGVVVLVVKDFCSVDTVHQVGTTAKTSALSQQQLCIA